jgi:hypothetical protein
MDIAESFGISYNRMKFWGNVTKCYGFSGNHINCNGMLQYLWNCNVMHCQEITNSFSLLAAAMRRAAPDPIWSCWTGTRAANQLLGMVILTPANQLRAATVVPH